MQRDDVPPKRLAELYGIVVTPEEARRFYRRQAWIRVAAIWGVTVLMAAFLLVMRAAGA
jgi:hypothetical protein